MILERFWTRPRTQCSSQREAVQTTTDSISGAIEDSRLPGGALDHLSRLTRQARGVAGRSDWSVQTEAQGAIALCQGGQQEAGGGEGEDGADDPRPPGGPEGPVPLRRG